MRNVHRSACVMLAAIFLAACAQQPTRPQPAPVEETSPPPTPVAPAAPKPKPKPKPAPPKADTKESDVTPAPATVATPAAEGIERAQVGYYFDTLQGRLRQVADPTIVITRNDGHITVDVTQRVRFSADGADCAALTPIARALIEYKMTRIGVEVRADTADEASAKARAAAVVKCLADAGIAGKRLGVRGVTTSAASPVTMLRIEPIVK